MALTISTHAYKALRDAPWLTGDRAGAYGRVLLIMLGLSVAYFIWRSHDGIDLAGNPLGADYLSFWTASKFALAGHPEAVYHPLEHAAAQHAAFPQANDQYSAFFYPPTYLLLCLPLGAVPYLWSLGLWLSATGFAYWRAVRGFLGRASAIPFFAYPAAFFTVAHGQNAFLTTALFGGAILNLNRRPILAGVLFGALSFKPHLGLLIPVALLAARRWRTFAAAAAATIGFALLSLAVFGAETWAGFFKVTALARVVMEGDYVGYDKMASVFAAVALVGGPKALAYSLQALAALIAAGSLIWLQRKSPRGIAEGAALVAATPFASPFLLDYDLTLLAIPIAWLTSEGVRTGFLPWEKAVLVAAFFLVLYARAVAFAWGLPTAPFVMAALLACVLRRGLRAA